MSLYSTVQIQIWFSEAPVYSFCPFAALISVCFLLYKFEHFRGEEYFKYIPGRAVLSYMEVFIYPWYSGECSFLIRLILFFPS